MRRIELGQALGILANFGVLIGILLLVYELGQNRQMMRSQARSAISDTLVSIVFGEAMNEGFAEISVKARTGEQLSPVELERFESYQIALWRYRENVHYQYRNGLYEPSEYEPQRDTWQEIVNGNPLVREIWCNRRARASEEFVTEIDGLLETPC